MGLFRNRKKPLLSESPTDALGWLAFIVAVLAWILDSLKKFPQVPARPPQDENVD